MKTQLTGAVGVVLLILGITRPNDPSNTGSPGTSEPLRIVVVGHGLKNIKKVKIDSQPLCASSAQATQAPGQQLAACAMSIGAYSAYFSTEFNGFRDMVDLESVDDTDPHHPTSTVGKAAEVAKAINDDPQVIAVIGHSYSDATKKAAPIYAGAQIPLLIPIATSTDIAVSSDGFKPPATSSTDGDTQSNYLSQKRFQNIFRLIPNDRIGQAPSIYYLLGKLHSATSSLGAVVLSDLTENRPYAKGLQDEILSLIPDLPYGQVLDTCKSATLTDSCIKWSDTKGRSTAQIIVFIGTTDTSARFLKTVVTSQNAGHPLPSALKYILLSDGAKNVFDRYPELVNDLVSDNIPIILTFPAKELFESTNKPDTKLLLTLAPPEKQSYEAYGFDSMLLIRNALVEASKPADKRVSRQILIENLKATTFLPGANGYLVFSQGENVHPDYGLYGLGTDAVLTDLQQTLCTKHKGEGGLPQLTTQTSTRLRYMCYLGFDEVHF